MSDTIDFILDQGWEPIGKRIRTIESTNVLTERARKLMVRYRRVTEGGVPPAEKDQEIAAVLSDLAGRTMSDTELVTNISRYVQLFGWSKEYCYGLACNISFAILEEPDQFSYPIRGSSA